MSRTLYILFVCFVVALMASVGIVSGAVIATGHASQSLGSITIGPGESRVYELTVVGETVAENTTPETTGGETTTEPPADSTYTVDVNQTIPAGTHIFKTINVPYDASGTQIHASGNGELEYRITETGADNSFQVSGAAVYTDNRTVSAGERTIRLRAEGGDITVEKLVYPKASDTGGSTTPGTTTEPSTGAKVYPADFVASVVDYGAIPNDGKDDTEAIRKAIADQLGGGHGQNLYIPEGTFHISKSLWWDSDYSTAGAQFDRGLRLMGAGKGKTILKLKDNTFNDASAHRTQKAVVYVAESGSGAGCYQRASDIGGGNCGFRNFVQDFTVDLGQGNTEAVGIDFHASNWGGMRHVEVKGNGDIGVRIDRPLPGPATITDVNVQGSRIGLQAGGAHYLYGVEHLNLKGQSVAGVKNTDSMLAIRDLNSTQNGVPAVINDGSKALLTLDKANMTGGSGPAIKGTGHMYLDEISASGYGRAVQTSVGSGADSNLCANKAGLSFTHCYTAYDEEFPPVNRSLNLPVEETPENYTSDLTKWANVHDFGASPGGGDDSAAIQAAIDSGAEVVYFPHAGADETYHISKTLILRGNVGLFIGPSIKIQPAAGDSLSALNPWVKMSANQSVVTHGIRWMPMNDDSAVSATVFEHVSSALLAIVDSGCPLRGNRDWRMARSCYEATSTAGTLFVDDVFGEDYHLRPGQKFFARQLNLEGGIDTASVDVNGASAWVLQVKSEGLGVNILTRNGGATEVLGGLHYPVNSTAGTPEIYTDSESKGTYSFATYSNGTSYADVDLVKETRNGNTSKFTNSEAEPRGAGAVVVPLYSGD